MKKLIILVLLFSFHALLSQENKNKGGFSSFRLGLLGGVNLSPLMGGSILIEGKTNLAQDINLKFSVGYSVIRKRGSYTARTFEYLDQINGKKIDEYRSISYNVDKIIYDVFPASLGFDYTFIHDKFSPFVTIEAGYNYFNYHLETSNGVIGAAYSKTLQALPVEYQNYPPAISEGRKTAIRYALGLGANYKLTQNINLDIRYLYQFNNLIVNTNQFLLGINF